MAPKIPTKVEQTFNFLEIRAMNTHPDNQLFGQVFTCWVRITEILMHCESPSLPSLFFFSPSIFHADGDVTDGNRKFSPSSESSVETQRACGGFSETYAALCDYNGITCKEEVQWDVDTIYHSQDNREFNLLDFSHLESGLEESLQTYEGLHEKSENASGYCSTSVRGFVLIFLSFVSFCHRDLAVIVAAMAYNSWFTKLYCKDLRISSEVVEQILHTVSKSSSLEELTLENVGLKADFPQKMATALSENPASVIHSINLAHNTLDNQGVSNLIQQVCRLSKGLRLLNLSKTSLSSKGVTSLSQALCSSDDYSNSLLHLDLSKNPGILSGEDATNLYLFLAQPNCLVHLDLSGTDCTVDSLFGALLRGCCADLSYLNLSKNSFSHRKVRETLPSFRQFFSSAFSLTHISLASVPLTEVRIKMFTRQLLFWESQNVFKRSISNRVIPPPGSRAQDGLSHPAEHLILALFCQQHRPTPEESAMEAYNRMLSPFNEACNAVSNDDVPVFVSCHFHRALFLGLSSNPHITDLHLDISGCELRSAGAGIIQDLFPRVSCISTLDISDNGLDADLLCVIPAFSRHPSLKHLLLGKNFNIKGRVLDEVLQKLVHLVQEEECALQSLSLADSRLRSRGTVLVNALGSNACLKKVDLSGNGLDDTGARMLNVARALEHNFTLQYMPIPLSDVTQAYRSSPERTEQALTKIQRALLRNNQTQRFSQKQALRLHQGLVTSTAEQVMERLCVRVQQQLYPSLCELAHVLSVDGPVRQRLDSLAGELAKAADKELQVIVDSMVSLCRELCPLSCAAAECLSPPLSSISERVSIPRSSIRTALMERAAQDINRALEEVKLSVVSYLTNSIVDQILQELYATHKTLVLHTNFSLHSSVHSEHVLKRRSSSRICSSSQLRQVSQMRRLEDGGTARRTHRHADILDVVEDDFGISIDTIAIKKRSSRTRRIRPVSNRLTSWEGLSTLPTQGSPLRHVTHVRPRPPRRHRTAHAPFEAHCSENGGVSLLDDGLPDFYTKRVLPDSQLSSHHHAQALRRKKRRSVLSIFSGFRKNRNSTISYQESDSTGRGGACGEECRTNIATENVYSLIQHPKDRGRLELGTEGTNGRLVGPGVQRTPQLSGRSSPDYSEVFGSSEEIGYGEHEMDRHSDIIAKGHTPSIDRQSESGRQESQSDSQKKPDSLMDPQLLETRKRPEPPPQSAKPSLAKTRQRHLEESSDKSTEDSGELREKDEEKDDRGCGEDQKDQKPEGQTPPIPEKPCYYSPHTSPIDSSPHDVANENQPPAALPTSAKPVLHSASDTRSDLERSSDRKPPVKKPRLPPKRNKSLDFPGTVLFCVIRVRSQATLKHHDNHLSQSSVKTEGHCDAERRERERYDQQMNLHLDEFIKTLAFGSVISHTHIQHILAYSSELFCLPSCFYLTTVLLHLTTIPLFHSLSVSLPLSLLTIFDIKELFAIYL
ncbi:Capping protein, Arp2/3 and myosin-I linker protein 3 [Labeo rohita]|uniref:Capping protein, Arp2/3 and myosin-I linker protein 3 n=1 Tax=Labeo rohita TaxID=84645 RepID=A0ABQ8MZZ9_LABRO|nr:Capping protein, Arp2/3 and myosin-I linker protein 3 [Labeo rohita]